MGINSYEEPIRKEYHSWDYKGDEGAYESASSHYNTGINGLYHVRNKPAVEIYSAISSKYIGNKYE